VVKQIEIKPKRTTIFSKSEIGGGVKKIRSSSLKTRVKRFPLLVGAFLIKQLIHLKREGLLFL
jgi:hypothetical protein